MGEGSARIYNLIATFFLLLTIVVLVLGIARLAGPGIASVQQGAVPTVMVLPTATETLPPTRTQIPTWTPTPTETATEIPTDTPIPTLAPTLPPTFTITPTQTPTITPSETPTPTLTPTQTITQTPTVPSIPPTVTTSPFPFTLRNNQLAFTSNFANTAGCQWQGMGGAVFDLNDQPLNGIRVHVFGGQGVDLYTASGTNTLYGQGGWEIQVDTTISTQIYYIELQSQEGTTLSPTVQITYPGSCEGNLAVINFEQTRPF